MNQFEIDNHFISTLVVKLQGYDHVTHETLYKYLPEEMKNLESMTKLLNY